MFFGFEKVSVFTTPISKVLHQQWNSTGLKSGYAHTSVGYEISQLTWHMGKESGLGWYAPPPPISSKEEWGKKRKHTRVVFDMMDVISW
jgi:hypothetical protein